MRTGEGQRGQATIEFALILPLFVLCCLAVAQAGLIARDALLVHHAAREGARAAAVDPGSAASAAQRATGLDPSRMQISTRGGTARGDRLGVVVQYQIPTTVPLIGALLGDVPVEAVVWIRVE